MRHPACATRIPVVLALLMVGASAQVRAQAPTRAQTPAPPYPYEVTEVEVVTDERLACTIAQPAGEDGAPGAVLLTVAGPNDRDQTHSGHKPYMVLADHLARAGIASIRCDDRGVGGSTGELTTTSIETLASDALAMVAALREATNGPVGVIGNSEGSVVGSLAAAETEDVAFAVLLGGVGVTGAELIRERLKRQAISMGRTEDQAEQLLGPLDAVTEVVLEVGGVGVEELQATRPELYERLVEVTRTTPPDPFLPSDLDERVAVFAGPWYHGQLALDGGAVLERVDVPVLALTGSLDRTNVPDQNLPAIEAALERGGNADYTVTEVPRLNHVFQTAERGGMMEYAMLDESFSPVALETIHGWISDRFTPSPPVRSRR